MSDNAKKLFYNVAKRDYDAAGASLQNMVDEYIVDDASDKAVAMIKQMRGEVVTEEAAPKEGQEWEVKGQKVTVKKVTPETITVETKDGKTFSIKNYYGKVKKEQPEELVKCIDPDCGWIGTRSDLAFPGTPHASCPICGAPTRELSMKKVAGEDLGKWKRLNQISSEIEYEKSKSNPDKEKLDRLYLDLEAIRDDVKFKDTIEADRIRDHTNDLMRDIKIIIGEE